MEEKIIVQKKEEIINNIAKPITYWIAFSHGYHMSGFHVSYDQAKELLEKLKDSLNEK